MQKGPDQSQEDVLARQVIRYALLSNLLNVMAASCLVVDLMPLLLFPMILWRSVYLVGVSPIAVGFLILTLLCRDQIRNSGDVTYAEARAAYQRIALSRRGLSARESPPEPKAPSTDDILQVSRTSWRLALASYLRAGDLPFAPGRFGPLIYILMGVGFLALNIMLTR